MGRDRQIVSFMHVLGGMFVTESILDNLAHRPSPIWIVDRDDDAGSAEFSRWTSGCGAVEEEGECIVE
jgi:hypothetical protein